MTGKPTYFLELRNIAPMRSRSYESAQLIIVHENDSEVSLLIRQPYLEGMFPQEYSIILHTLRTLSLEGGIHAYFDAQIVSETTLAGQVYPVNHYFSRRFHKYTETGFDHLPDIILNQPQDEGEKSLYISEGCMLPTHSELNLARKAQFELFTVTNFSFMDIATYMGINI